MTDMADPYYAEMKQHKRDADWLFACMYANYCIPKKCTCGGAITVETDERGRNYYVCKVFEVRMVVTLINSSKLLNGNQSHKYYFPSRTMVCTSDVPAMTQSRKSLMWWKVNFARRSRSTVGCNLRLRKCVRISKSLRIYWWGVADRILSSIWCNVI